MLFSNLNRRYDINGKLHEGNFISKDFTGIFDKDAQPYLSKLTIDKLFEGLDLEKSNEMHNNLITSIPSIKDVMGLNRAGNTLATELITKQLVYMQNRLDTIEKEMLQVSNKIISVATTAKTSQEARDAISSVTGPVGIASIYPRIEKIVAKYGQTINFKESGIKQIIEDLANIKMNTIIEGIQKSIDSDSRTKGINDIYKVIDSYQLEEIEAISAKTHEVDFIGSPIKPLEMVKTVNPYERLAGFYEQVLSSYNYGKKLKSSDFFGQNYESIKKSSGRLLFPTPVAIGLFSKFDKETLMPFYDFLSEVGSELVNRIYPNSPEEDTKNLFTPIFQVTFISLLSILGLRLISFDIAKEGVFVKKEEETKKQKETEQAQAKVATAKSVIEAGKNLYDLGFFNSTRQIIRVGSKANPEIVKNLNNFLVALGILPKSKFNDTTYDSITADGVKVYQTKVDVENKILKDGIVGNQTRAKMLQTYNDVNSKYKS